jgi:predicted P-loop ATPase
MRQVTVRVPYAHYDINKQALSSFVGTINNEAGFLNDPTGHTRYMTVHLRDIDWNYANDVDVDQVWAQAYQAYLDGESGKLKGEELETVNRINEGYEIADPLTDLILTNFEIDNDRKDWWMSSNAIRDILKRNDWSLRTPRGESMAISSELSRLGLESKRGEDAETGARVRGYTGIRYRISEEKEIDIPWPTAEENV